MLLGPQAMGAPGCRPRSRVRSGRRGSWCAEAWPLRSPHVAGPSDMVGLTVPEPPGGGHPRPHRPAQGPGHGRPYPRHQSGLPPHHPAEKYEAGRREDFFDQPLTTLCASTWCPATDSIETALTRGVPIVPPSWAQATSWTPACSVSPTCRNRGPPPAVRKELRRRGILHHRGLWVAEEPSSPAGGARPPAAAPSPAAWPGCLRWPGSCWPEKWSVPRRAARIKTSLHW